MRRAISDSSPFDTLRLEGALFTPALLEQAARGTAKGQSESDYAIPKGLKLHEEYGRAFRIASALWQDFATQIPRADLDPAATTRAFATDFLRQCLGYTDLTPCPAPIDANGEPSPSSPASRHPSSLNPHPSSSSPSSFNLHTSYFFRITALAASGSVPVIIAPHTLGLDDPDPRFAVIGAGARKKSAHQLAQEFLNASKNCLWAIVTNGRVIRLLRDAETLTRPNFLEFDLETILREPEARYADFSALWRILHATRAGTISPQGSSLQPSSLNLQPSPASTWETWKQEGHSQGIRVRDGLRAGVTDALRILGTGFLAHKDNSALRQRLLDGSLTKDDYFQQLLRLIYRFLFLFCAEERDLLHPPEGSSSARQSYFSGYSLRRLRSRCLRLSAHDTHSDLWQSLRIVFQSLATGQPRLALPALGGLFAPAKCPDISVASLGNRELLMAMRLLRWFQEKNARRPAAIDYRNMGPEELGSVYESLLELVPIVNVLERRFGFVGLDDAGSTAGNARKTTGSYYTPDSVVQELIKSALDPVIYQRLADARKLAGSPWTVVAKECEADPVKRAYVIDYLTKASGLAKDSDDKTFARAWDAIPADTRATPLCIDALLALTVCDPSCGSGHFLLAAARRIAEKLAELRAPDGAVKPEDYRHALREVASRCIFGVDINPMAVELCRVALWLETVDPGKPLGFLDHHIRCGNSLLGTTPDLIAAGLPDDTFIAIEGDDKKACAELKKRNKKEGEGFGPLFEKEDDAIREKLRTTASAIEAMDDSQPEALQKKETAFVTNEAAPEFRHAKMLADLWCAAFVIKKRFPEGQVGDSPASSSQAPNSPLEAAPILPIGDDLFGQPISAPSPAKQKPGIHHTSFFNLPIGITNGSLRGCVQGKQLPADLEAEVQNLASQYRFFHWHLAFPQVFANGGFDCILGNPPWVRQELLRPIKRLLVLFRSFVSTADSSVYFLELGARICRSGGRLAMLTPNKWFRANYADKLRTVLKELCQIELAIDFGHSRNLFPDADTFPAAVVVERVSSPANDSTLARFVRAHDSDRESRDLASLIRECSITVPHSNFQQTGWQFEDESISKLLTKLTTTGNPLESLIQRPILRGLLTGFNQAFYVETSIRDALIRSDPSAERLLKKLLRGRDVKRWNVSWGDQWHIVIPSGQNHSWPWTNAKSEIEAENIFTITYPSIHSHLKQFEVQLRDRQDKGQYWWELRSCDYYSDFELPKIIVQCIAYYSQFALDDAGHYVNNKAIIIPTDDLYLLGILNSRIMWWIVNRTFQHMKDDGLSVDVHFLRQLPIPSGNDKLRSEIVNTTRLLLAASRSPAATAAIAQLEIQLNMLVELAFDLSDTEKKVLLDSLPPRDPLLPHEAILKE